MRALTGVKLGSTRGASREVALPGGGHHSRGHVCPIDARWQQGYKLDGVCVQHMFYMKGHAFSLYLL